MKLRLPYWARILIYAVNVLGQPVMVYLLAKGHIGTLEMALWGAESSAAFMLAGLNVPIPLDISIHDVDNDAE